MYAYFTEKVISSKRRLLSSLIVCAYRCKKHKRRRLPMKMNITDTHKLVENQIWYSGSYFEQESGEKCYFVCQHLQERYTSSQEKPFTMVCTQKNEEVENPAEFCTMDCEYFARCESCKGFSATICQSCVHPVES